MAVKPIKLQGFFACPYACCVHVRIEVSAGELQTRVFDKRGALDAPAEVGDVADPAHHHVETAQVDDEACRQDDGRVDDVRKKLRSLRRERKKEREKIRGGGGGVEVGTES